MLKTLLMFQFHEGPIKTLLKRQQDWSEKSFNSMKVRLKRKVSGVISAVILFQFHEGPIKTLPLALPRFSLFWFQFHEGPIKTR